MRNNLKSLRLLLTLLASTALAACTLMDNDLRDLHDIPGYDNVVHVEDEDMTCDYQYQDNTIVMDERYEPYIQSIDYKNQKLYMYDYTPEEMLPKVGQPLISPQNAKLEWGIMHRPTSVRHEGDLYVLDLEKATLDDIFKEFKLDGEWNLIRETEYDINLEDTTYTEVYDNVRRTRASNGFENYDGDWYEVDILSLLSTVVGSAALSSKRWELAATGIFASSFNFSWPRNVERDASGRLKKGSDGIAVNASVQGEIRFRWKTLCKVKKTLDKNGHKVEIVSNIGSTFELIPQVTGKIELTANFWDILKLKNPTFGPLGGPLPIFVVLEPSVDFTLSLEGTLGYKWTKTFRTEYAVYNNISGKKDGVSLKNQNTPIKREAYNEIRKWSGESESDMSLQFSAEAGIGLTSKVVFGSPDDYPNVGVAVGAHVGARFTTKTAKGQTDYDKAIHFSIPLKLTGTVFLSIWDGFKLEKSWADAIAKLSGKEEGAEWEFAKTDFRVYPSFDNVSITCTNKDELLTTPKFDISFSVKNQGMKMWENVRPVLKFYLHDDPKKSTILKIDDRTPTKNPQYYNWTVNDPRLFRGVVYDAEISWVEKREVYEIQSATLDDAVAVPTGETIDRELCSKAYTFSTESPTVYTDGHTITMQKRWESFDQKKWSSTQQRWVVDVFYDFHFRTHHRFVDRNYISDWGIVVGSKTFKFYDTPPADEVNIMWRLTKQKESRTLKIQPYVTPVDTDTPIFGEAKTIEIKYDPSKNTYEKVHDHLGKGIDKLSYWTWGFDDDEKFENDYDMGDQLKSRRKDYVADDPNTFVIDLDELLDDEDGETE